MSRTASTSEPKKLTKTQNIKEPENASKIINIEQTSVTIYTARLSKRERRLAELRLPG